MFVFNEVNVEIKPITDLVLECSCCPDTFLRKPETISENRRFRYVQCHGFLGVGKWGIDPRKTHFTRQIIINDDGSELTRVTPVELPNSGLEGARCGRIVTSSGVGKVNGNRLAVEEWDGNLPPTYTIETRFNGEQSISWSDPVYASAIRPIIDDGILNVEWGNGGFGLDEYSYLVESSRGRVIEGRSKVRVELQSAGLLWRFTSDILLIWDKFMPQVAVGNPRFELDPVYETVSERVTVDFLLDFVNEDEEFYNTGRRTMLETDWFYIKDMAIEAGLEIPPDDSYTLQFSNTTITQEVTDAIQ